MAGPGINSIVSKIVSVVYVDESNDIFLMRLVTQAIR